MRRTTPPHCDGPPIIIRTGVFVGTIRFHGERGYTAVEASRARGKIRTIANWRCGRESPQPTEAGVASVVGRPVVLEAKGRHSGFKVATERPPTEEGETRFLAGKTERRGGMHIFRNAYAFGRERTFAFDRELSRAKVEPPRPFHGSARYIHDTDGRSWTGSLRVELPGAGTVSLTGKGYSARLYIGRPEDAPGYSAEGNP